MSHHNSTMKQAIPGKHLLPCQSEPTEQDLVPFELYRFEDASPEAICCPSSQDRSGFQLPTDEASMLSRWENHCTLSDYPGPEGIGGNLSGGPGMLCMPGPYNEYAQSPPSTDGRSSPGSFVPPPSPSTSSYIVDDNNLGGSCALNIFYPQGSGPTSSPSATSQQPHMVRYPRDTGAYPGSQPSSGKHLYLSSSVDMVQSPFGTCASTVHRPEGLVDGYRIKEEEPDQSPEMLLPGQSPQNATKTDPKNKEAYIPCPFQFARCTKLFKTKNEWKRHVNKIHIEPEYWACSRRMCRNKNPKDRYFNRDDLFKTHYKRMHLSHKSEGNYKCTTTQESEAVRATQAARRARPIKFPRSMTCPVQGCPDKFKGDKMLDCILEHLFRHHRDARDYGTEKPLVGGRCSPAFTAWAAQNEFIVPCGPDKWQYVRAVERTQTDCTVQEDVDAEGEDEW